jgi:hypothetical protein
MNPLFQRITTVESELSELQHNARRLSETIKKLKSEAFKNEVLETTSVTPEIVERACRPPLPPEKEAPLSRHRPSRPSNGKPQSVVKKSLVSRWNWDGYGSSALGFYFSPLDSFF